MCLCVKKKCRLFKLNYLENKKQPHALIIRNKAYNS
jgi:hypothetical protein